MPKKVGSLKATDTVALITDVTAGSAVAALVELDFGWPAVSEKDFIVVNGLITPSSKIMVSSFGGSVSVSEDEVEMDTVHYVAYPQTGQMRVHAVVLRGWKVGGLRPIVYYIM